MRGDGPGHILTLASLEAAPFRVRKKAAPFRVRKKARHFAL